MLCPDKTELEDLPQVWEVPNIIPKERRAAFFELIGRSRDELSELFRPTEPPYLQELEIHDLNGQITRWVWSTMSSLHKWFVHFLDEYDPPIDPYTIENTVRQLEGIGSFLAYETWAYLRFHAEWLLGSSEKDVKPYGRRILSEINKQLILTVQHFRDWGEKKRLEPADRLKAKRKRGSASEGKRRAGRPPDTNATADERLYEEWQESGMTQKEFIRERCLPSNAVRKARDRIQKRREKEAE